MNKDKEMMQNKRFVDEGTKIYEFNDEFLVVCPKCQKMAKVVPEYFSEKPNKQLFSPRKFICLNCPHRDVWDGKQILTGANVDWYFRLPLWLQISCCGETLWAYNLKHLEIIEQYVSAKLRERKKKAEIRF
jgi:hypothetical protein